LFAAARGAMRYVLKSLSESGEVDDEGGDDEKLTFFATPESSVSSPALSDFSNAGISG
jgi:hypothetical protein